MILCLNDTCLYPKKSVHRGMVKGSDSECSYIAIKPFKV